MTILALDLGKKRVGVAISHGFVAQAIAVLDFGDSFLDDLAEIVEHEKVEEIVIGLPLSKTGAETEQSIWNKAEGEKIEKHFGLHVEYVDEAYSTVSLDSRSNQIDALSAKIILEQYLNEKESLSGKGNTAE